MSLPTIAIIGRPNVGKSSFMNAVAGRRVSIVEPTPGVTRDRISTRVERGGRAFELLDTGGIGVIDEARLDKHIERQIEAALHLADVVIFLVDGKDGPTPLDEHVATVIRKLSKPIVLGVNKIDHPSQEARAFEFFKFGLGEPLPMSALEGMGILDVLDQAIAKLPPVSGAADADVAEAFAGEDDSVEAGGEDLEFVDEALPLGAEGELDFDSLGLEGLDPLEEDARKKDREPESEDSLVKIAVAGKRNAGKSTFLNAIVGHERVIVSEIPGTTRDAVDVDVEFAGRRFTLIDTAGMMRKARISTSIDFYSQVRTVEAIKRAQVVLFMIDALADISLVDKKLAQTIAEEKKPCLLVVNKWDLAEGNMTTEDYAKYLADRLPGLHFAPVVFGSAKKGLNLKPIVSVAFDLFRQAGKKVGTGELNRLLASAIEKRRPPGAEGHKAKIFYGTQTGVHPPEFRLFVNDVELFTDDYRRYLENEIRAAFDFREIPVRVALRRRESKFHE